MKYRIRKCIVGLLVVQAVGFAGLLVIASGEDPVAHAIAWMALWLNVIWVLGFGGICAVQPNLIARGFRQLPGRWPVQFILACTLLALVEEAVTTSLSNLATAFGDPTGEAKITASTNYLEVVALHSVVVFVPMFVAWAWLLGRWRFSPFAALLLFGAVGLLAETLSFGPQMLVGFGQWILVYGLLVYLPVRTFAPPASSPPWWAYLVALVLPLLATTPVVILLAGVQALT